MEEILQTVTKMENKNKEFYEKLRKQIAKYEKENKRLKEELEKAKIKYEQETEIIVKLDLKIYDLKDENTKLKQLLEENNNSKPKSN